MWRYKYTLIHAGLLACSVLIWAARTWYVISCDSVAGFSEVVSLHWTITTPTREYSVFSANGRNVLVCQIIGFSSRSKFGGGRRGVGVNLPALICEIFKSWLVSREDHFLNELCFSLISTGGVSVPTFLFAKKPCNNEFVLPCTLLIRRKVQQLTVKLSSKARIFSDGIGSAVTRET